MGILWGGCVIMKNPHMNQTFNAELYKESQIVKRKNIAFKIFLYVIMSVIAVILLTPYVVMLGKSLMTIDEIDKGMAILPSKPQFSNFITVFKTGGYGKGFLWTSAIILINIIIVPFSATLIAYSFAKLKWFGKNVMFAVMLGTMMLPSAVTQLPLYVMYGPKYFNWLNTIMPFTIPNLFGGGAVYIFLIRQFMMGISNEMENAAKIDGANAFTRYTRIVLPLCKPVIIYVMVQVFIAYWGDYYGPLVYMTSSTAPKTLALILYNFITDNSTGAKTNVLMAGAVFMSVIPTIIFAIFQKQLIEGVQMTGLKG